MIERLKNWFRQRFSGDDPSPKQGLHGTGVHAAQRPASSQKKAPRRNPEFVAADEDLSGTIESNGPGKNVLVRNKFVREDTGTHETLKILDDSIVDSGEDPGLDPYNTGGFDRSKNWERRFGK
jgi:hypothetical protein